MSHVEIPMYLFVECDLVKKLWRIIFHKLDIKLDLQIANMKDRFLYTNCFTEVTQTSSAEFIVL